jgi:hypothetical protein
VNRVDDICRFQITGLATINVENLNGVLNGVLKVDRKVMAVRCCDAGEDKVVEKLLILNQAGVLLIQQRLKIEQTVVNTNL